MNSFLKEWRQDLEQRIQEYNQDVRTLTEDLGLDKAELKMIFGERRQDLLQERSDLQKDEHEQEQSSASTFRR